MGENELRNFSYNYCLLGATNEHLSDFFDVAVKTIDNWKHDYSEFLQALRNGKAVADKLIEEGFDVTRSGIAKVLKRPWWQKITHFKSVPQASKTSRKSVTQNVTVKRPKLADKERIMPVLPCEDEPKWEHEDEKKECWRSPASV